MRKWIPLLIVAAAFIASAVVYPRLPQTMPTHWSVNGQPNDWSNRLWGAWMIPLFLVGMWALFRFLPVIDPRGRNYAKFAGTFEGIITSVMLFMLGLHILVLRAALGHPINMGRVLPIGLGTLFIVIGNLLPRARPNWFVGLRTPWTLSSDRVWEKTHRFGGRVFVAGGVLMLLAAFFSAQWAHVILFSVILICSAGVLVYSYVEWRREQQPASTAGSQRSNQL
jgi:uncharacterized membrane protein